MTAPKKPGNPVYAVVVAAALLFALTACAYGVLMVRDSHPSAAGTAPESGLLAFLDRHGFRLLLGELAVLAVATVTAMATDDFWTKRRSRESS
ncbi:MAG: hypothetical protein U0935_20520 [Pirellulales bacterium]